MDIVAAQSSLARQVVDAVRAVVGFGPVALHEPCFDGNEWTYLKECLDSTFVSSVGPFVDRFETELAVYTGAKYAVAVVNGTAALHLGLLLAGVQQGDEVLIPALTFVATANAVAHCGATPHFADSEERTIGMDPVALRGYLNHIAQLRNGHCVNRLTGRVIRALVPMHTFGHPVDLAGMLSLARDFHLVLVEDAAESLGSTYHGRHTGTFGKVGTLSFNGNKIITTGGGGAILSNDGEIARRAKHLSTTAKIPHRWEYIHDDIAFNYRLPNLNAALGCAQLEHLPSFLASKRRLFGMYQVAMAPLPIARLVVEPEGCTSNYWLSTLLLDESVAHERDAILTNTNDAGLMTRPAWALLPRLKPYQNCPKMDLPVAESLAQRLINLPSSAQLGQE